MAELQAYDSFRGYIPWAMTQDQRGPTCGMTSIAVAYRILTGWTVFPTKGNYRQFMSDRRKIKLKKGQEGILSVRKAAKYDDVTAAGEIVNATDMATVINLHAEGVAAKVIKVKGGMSVGNTFVSAVREAFRNGHAPIVLFYIDGDTDNVGREYIFQHWVNIYAVEHKTKWLYTPMKHLSYRDPLVLTTPPKKDEIMIWTWGSAWTIDGPELGKASALSINWKSPARMWEKEVGKHIGELNWKEIAPRTKDYVEDKPSSKKLEVRYTTVAPSVALEARGFVVMAVS